MLSPTNPLTEGLTRIDDLALAALSAHWAESVEAARVPEDDQAGHPPKGGGE